MSLFAKDQSLDLRFELTPKYSGLRSPLLRCLFCHLSPGLLSTARQLDRESKEEHILEVCSGGGPSHWIQKREGGWAGAEPGHRATCVLPGTVVEEEEPLKLGLAVAGGGLAGLAGSLALGREDL